MCEFCTEHGEGKKWYLVMNNYSRELQAQVGGAEYFEKFMATFEEKAGKIFSQLNAVRNIPLAYRFIRRMLSRKLKTDHFGQVVPIEDVEQIIDLQDSIVRIPCVCRSLTTGRRCLRYCFGIGVDPTKTLGKYPDNSDSLESIEKEEAKKIFRSFDKEGLVHSIWTFKTPYIGAICNCDQDCIGYRLQVKEKLLPLLIRSEYVSTVDWELCSGCKKCIAQCQFKAIFYSNNQNKVSINVMECYGCGLCRAVCEKGAITLKSRAAWANVQLPWIE